MPGTARRTFKRLPAHVVPRKYALTLAPDLDTFTFEGEEVIDLALAKPVRKITLHCKDLEIRSAAAGRGSGSMLASRIDYDPDSETATLEFPKVLRRGRCLLKISFRGALSDDLRGFYRSAYESGGKVRYIATTQFETTDARRAFPCFDEPAIKAIFEVTLIVPREKTAISNTIPVSVRTLPGGRKAVAFAPTPKMSTYLLAFIVGDFEHLQKKTKEGVLVRVFTTPDKKRHAAFALDCAVRTLSFFTDYFGIPYPLPVLDMIAIPDFESQAMENWGAITYRESALLFDEEHSSIINKQWVAIVVAHELGHQWFGNLVTMEWWTHLWLNEGFALFIEYLAVDHLFPEWRIWDRFVSTDLGRALRLDSLLHTHPIEVDVHHPGEIDEIFDAVTYSKGGAVIRMLADYLGERAFRKGLNRYLKAHRYANTSTVHLWEAFEAASGKPVVPMMRRWTRHGGYPLLTVAKDDRGGLRVSQSRFFSNPRSRAAAAASESGPQAWKVPVRMTRAGAGKGEAANLFLLERRSARLAARESKGWLKLNAGEMGIMRVDYPAAVWQEFAAPIQAKELTVRDRLALMRDIAALAEAGLRSAPDVLEFARNYRTETEYIVWLEVAVALNQIYSVIAAEPFAGRYRAYARDMFSAAAAEIGWREAPGDDHFRKLLRGLLLSQLGYYGDRSTALHAKKLFATVTSGKNPIPPDLRDTVYNLTAQHGGPAEHARLIRLYKSSALHEEKNRFGVALGRFEDSTLLERTLEFAISKDVRPQDTLSIVASVCANPAGRATAWRFMKKRWQLLVARFGSGFIISRMVLGLGFFATEAEAKDVERFFKANPVPLTAKRSLAQALEQAHGNAAWLARDRRKLAAWLAANVR